MLRLCRMRGPTAWCCCIISPPSAEIRTDKNKNSHQAIDGDLDACAQAVSLDQKGDYTEALATQRYNVPFFAKAGHDFVRTYPKGSSSRLQLERVSHRGAEI